MKVIDLMQMYVNKEVLPKKIIIQDHQLYDEDTIWEHKSNSLYCREYNGDTQFLFEYIIPEMLNDEIEIIEDTPKENKKIEKISLDDWVEFTTPGDIKRIDYIFNKNCSTFVDKINEVIEVLNKKQ